MVERSTLSDKLMTPTNHAPVRLLIISFRMKRSVKPSLPENISAITFIEWLLSVLTIFGLYVPEHSDHVTLPIGGQVVVADQHKDAGGIYFVHLELQV